ncbi:MAG: protein translocase subunit SecF [Thermoanaerobacterales bacterium]|nr:protein translocase subunit SecF [Thermoanaerobacterales bacterium]
MTDDARTNGARAGEPEEARDRPADAAPSGDPATFLRSRSVWARLYHGETTVDFVGRWRIWFGLSAAVILVGVVAFVVRGGFNLGIDFEGGVVWQVPTEDVTVAEARDAVEPFGLAGSTIQELESDEGRSIRIEAEPVDPATSDEITATLAELTGTPVDDVVLDEVGPSWGREISEKALRALVVFLVLVTLYITVRFEWKMALPTLVALFHDILVVAGFYAVTQIEITPATVIALLTILGYSIYDGVVVFDKVDENSRYVSATGGLSYGGMVNVSLNQALMRSLNTNITAVLPVLALLVLGSWVMGAKVIEEFAIALLIGQISGAYSSIFIASPLLALLKEREPRFRDIKRRIDARGGDRDVVVATIALGRPPSGRSAPARPAAGGTGRAAPATVGSGQRVIPPRPRKKTKRPGRR